MTPNLFDFLLRFKNIERFWNYQKESKDVRHAISERPDSLINLYEI